MLGGEEQDGGQAKEGQRLHDEVVVVDLDGADGEDGLHDEHDGGRAGDPQHAGVLLAVLLVLVAVILLAIFVPLSTGDVVSPDSEHDAGEADEAGEHGGPPGAPDARGGLLLLLLLLVRGGALRSTNGQRFGLGSWPELGS